MERKLIFIYNADSGLEASIKGSVQKLKTGKSECSLCTATWGVFNKKASWSEKEKKLKIPYKYYHRDDQSTDIQGFLVQNKIALPTVLLGENGNLRQLVTNNQFDRCQGDEVCVWNLLKKTPGV